MDEFLRRIGYNPDLINIFKFVPHLKKLPKGMRGFNTYWNALRFKCVKDQIAMKIKRDGINFAVIYCPKCNYHIILEYQIDLEEKSSLGKKSNEPKVIESDQRSSESETEPEYEDMNPLEED